MHDDSGTGRGAPYRAGTAGTHPPCRSTALTPRSRSRSGHAPGEPVPAADAIARRTRRRRWGSHGGPRGVRAWFRLSGTVPAAWAGRSWNWSWTWVSTGPSRFMRGHDLPAGRHAGQGIHPDNRWVRIGTRCPAVRTCCSIWGRGQPGDHGEPAVRVTHLGDRATAGIDPLYRTARVRPGRFEQEVAELAPDVEVADHSCARCPPATRGAGSCCAPWTEPWTSRPERHRDARRQGAGRTGRRLSRPAHGQRAPDLGRRARAHRLGMAVAAA